MHAKTLWYHANVSRQFRDSSRRFGESIRKPIANSYHPSEIGALHRIMYFTPNYLSYTVICFYNVICIVHRIVGRRFIMLLSPPSPVYQFWLDSYLMIIGVGVSCHISYSIASVFSAMVIHVLVFFSVSVRRSLLLFLVLMIGYVILLRHTLGLPYNHF